jgi:hypothetical protein
MLKLDCGAFFAIGLLIGTFWNPEKVFDVFAAAGGILILGIGAAYIYYKVKTDVEN